RHEPIAVEPAAANEEGVRAGAAAQTGGFEVDEDERWTGRGTVREERRFPRCGAEAFRDRADMLAAVPGAPVPLPLHDVAAVGPLAAQSAEIASGFRIRDLGIDVDSGLATACSGRLVGSF